MSHANTGEKAKKPNFCHFKGNLFVNEDATYFLLVKMFVKEDASYFVLGLILNEKTYSPREKRFYSTRKMAQKREFKFPALSMVIYNR